MCKKAKGSFQNKGKGGVQVPVAKCQNVVCKLANNVVVQNKNAYVCVKCSIHAGVARAGVCTELSPPRQALCMAPSPR